MNGDYEDLNTDVIEAAGGRIVRTEPHPDPKAGGRVLRGIPDETVPLAEHARVDELTRAVDGLYDAMRTLSALMSSTGKLIDDERLRLYGSAMH